MRWKLLSKKSDRLSSEAGVPRPRGRWPMLLCETLEPRFAPVALVAGPNLLHEGDIGFTGDLPVVAVDRGVVIVWMDPTTEPNGISMSDGSAVTLFTDVHGDIVTNLNRDGSLSGPLHDGSVLLDADIRGITFSTSLTTHNADGTTTVTLIGTDGDSDIDGSIHGNILAGGKIENIGTISTYDASLGFTFNTTPTGVMGEVGIIATGTAAGGRIVDMATEVRLVPYAAEANRPYDVSNVQVLDFSGIITGNGGDNASGSGGTGGNISTLTVTTDTAAFFLVTGDGGDGVSQGGNGGSMTAITVTETSTNMIPIVTGAGGAATGSSGVGGDGGGIGNMTLSGSGAYQFSIGDGGAGVAKGGTGGSVNGVTSGSTILAVPTSTTTGLTATLSYALTPSPFGLADGDFNGDGWNDIVVADSGTSDISVQLDMGNSRFGRVINYQGGTRPGLALGTNNVAVADFNGDGILDIAATNSLTENVSIYLGNGSGGVGDGTFTWVANYYTAKGPQDLVASTDFDHDGHRENLDFNGDGFADIAILGSGSVTMLFGNGDGTFQTRIDPSLPWVNDFSVPAPFRMTAGDFNEDGRPDLAITDLISSDPLLSGFDIFLNKADGTGTFFAPLLFSILTGTTNGGTPQAITTDDIDLDGHLDLAISTLTPDAHPGNDPAADVQVMFGDGTGFFFTGPDLAVAGGDPRGLVIRDMTGDGIPDVVEADASGSVAYYTQLTNGASPTGTFSNGATSIPTDTNPVAIIAEDFNHDGKNDVMVAAADAGSATLHLGIVSATASGSGFYEFFTNILDDTESPRVVGTDKPSAVAFGDINHDGFSDMAVANSASETVQVFLGNGDGNFYNTPVLPTFIYALPAAAVATDIALASLNGTDTALDIVVSWYDAFTNDGGVSVFLGIPNGLGFGTGIFGGRADYATNGEHTVALTVVDAGGFGPTNAGATPDLATDGAPDIVVANFDPDPGKIGDNGSVSILYQNVLFAPAIPTGPDGTFRAGIVYGSTFLNRPSDVAVADMYGGAFPTGGSDGHLEIVTSNMGDDTIKFLSGVVNPTVPVATSLYGPPYGPLVPPLMPPPTVSRSSGGIDPVAVQIVDLNGDGFLDVVTANYGSDNIVALFGSNILPGGATVLATLPVGSSGPTDMLATDLTGDNIPDIVTVNAITNNVNVFVGSRPVANTYVLNTPFVFALPAGTEFPVPGSNPPPPESLSLGTALMNQDKVPDLAVTDFTSDQVTIFLGVSDTIAPKVPFDTVRHPANSLEIGAGNGGDGAIGGGGGTVSNVTFTIANASGFADNARPTDIDASNFFATANAGDDALALPSSGTPTSGIHPIAPEPRTLVVGDFNNDGFADYATVSFIDNRVYLLLGAGDFSGFWVQQVDGVESSFPSGGDGALDMVADDFNGDGLMDLAIANVFSDNVTILFGLPSIAVDPDTGFALARFSAPLVLPLAPGSHPQSIISDDFNGDHRPDIATADFGTNNASVLLSTGPGTFASHVEYAAGRGPSAVQSMDVDGDGADDLLVADFADNDVTVMLNNGSGVFTTLGLPINLSTPTQLANNPDGIFVNDFGQGFGVGVSLQSSVGYAISVTLFNGVFAIDTTDTFADFVGTGTDPWTIDEGFTANYDSNNLGPSAAPFPISVQGGVVDKVTLATGDGGTGSTGNGGNAANMSLLTGTVNRNSDLVLTLGNGGDGATNGGKGGSLLGTLAKPIQASVPRPSLGTIYVRTGDGGDGINGNGGAAGIVKFATLTANMDFFTLETSNTPFYANIIDGIQVITGDGGNSISGSGGQGGDISSVTAHVDDQESMSYRTGDGGNGGTSGGKGGSFFSNNFTVDSTGGDFILGILFFYESLFVQTGNGGDGLSSAGGAGGSVTRITTHGFLTEVINAGNGEARMMFLTGDGGDGTIGGKGGSLSNITLGHIVIGTVTQDANLVADTILVGTGSGGIGTAGNGGDGGSVTRFTGDAFEIVDFSTGDGGASATASGGKGGSISTITVNATVTSASYLAGNGGDGFSAGGAGGSIFNVRTNASTVMTLQAGDGGDAGSFTGKGGLGGRVSGITQRADPFLIISSIIAGDGGFGVALGGAGGSVVNVTLAGAIGDLTSSTYGTAGIGGIFTGVGGGTAPLGKRGANGSVSNITARAITNIVAGRGAIPVAATSIRNILVTALNFVGTSPLGRDVDLDGAFDFHDALFANGLYDAGEAPMDGLLMANSISGITVQFRSTNAPTVMTVPLFEFNPFTGQRIGAQSPNP